MFWQNNSYFRGRLARIFAKVVSEWSRIVDESVDAMFHTLTAGSQTALSTRLSVSHCLDPDAGRVAPIRGSVWCLRPLAWNECAHTDLKITRALPIQTFAAFCLHSALLGVIALIIRVKSSVGSVHSYLHYFCFYCRLVKREHTTDLNTKRYH